MSIDSKLLRRGGWRERYFGEESFFSEAIVTGGLIFVFGLSFGVGLIFYTLLVTGNL